MLIRNVMLQSGKSIAKPIGVSIVTVARLCLVALSLVLLAAPLSVRADDVAQFPIMADDGQPIANHSVPPELVEHIEMLKNIVVVANPKGKVTLYEFYDLNCPFCRRASLDLAELTQTHKELRLVLVPFPVLGIPSILAARVEYAVAKMASPENFYKFHHIIYGDRGVIDDKRAFAASQAIGLDNAEVRKIASEDAFATVMKEHLRVGDQLGIQATPGIVVGGVAFVGYPGKKALTRVIEAVAKCGTVMCP
ncbi:MAG: thioredoxin domain-containing protein [Proteobacteria bacterium]|nr:thioredoxin domain-containing protein [Pseudomonadota bacterium]